MRGQVAPVVICYYCLSRPLLSSNDLSAGDCEFHNADRPTEDRHLRSESEWGTDGQTDRANLARGARDRNNY
jgi:hypothetical protein